MELHLERSQFQILSVQQFVLACMELGFTTHSELTTLARYRVATIMRSSVCEHLHNWQKHRKQNTTWGGRYRRPHTIMATSIRGNAVAGLHRSNPLQNVVPSLVNAQPLRREDMSLVGKSSVDFSVVRGGKHKAPYCSPGVANVNAPVGDPEVHQPFQGDHHKLEVVWKGGFADATRLICVHSYSANDDDPWYVAWGHVADGAVLAYEAELDQVEARSNHWHGMLRFKTMNELAGVAFAFPTTMMNSSTFGNHGLGKCTI